MPTLRGFPGGKRTNSRYRCFGSADQLTRFRPPQQLHQWLRATPNLQPGDLVLMKEDITTPLHWPIAVITNIHPNQMASFVWLHLGTPTSTPSTLQKFKPHRM